MKLNALSRSLRIKTRVFAFRRVNNVVLCSISPLWNIHLRRPHTIASHFRKNRFEVCYYRTPHWFDVCNLQRTKADHNSVRHFWRPRNQNVMQYYVAFKSIFISTRQHSQHYAFIVREYTGNMRLKIHLKYTKMCVYLRALSIGHDQLQSTNEERHRKRSANACPFRSNNACPFRLNVNWASIAINGILIESKCRWLEIESVWIAHFAPSSSAPLNGEKKKHCPKTVQPQSSASHFAIRWIVVAGTDGNLSHNVWRKKMAENCRSTALVNFRIAQFINLHCVCWTIIGIWLPGNFERARPNGKPADFDSIRGFTFHDNRVSVSMQYYFSPCAHPRHNSTRKGKGLMAALTQCVASANSNWMC